MFSKCLELFFEGLWWFLEKFCFEAGQCEFHGGRVILEEFGWVYNFTMGEVWFSGGFEGVEWWMSDCGG